jgi:hypothetical protein
MTEKDAFTEFWGEPISVYTSEQAESDGILIKVDHPQINYITHTVWETCIEPFIESMVMTDRSLSNKLRFEVVDVGEKSIVMPLKITEQENTKAVEKLIGKLLASVVDEIRKINKPDWFFAIQVRGWKFFVAMNETGKFTCMFPEEY